MIYRKLQGEVSVHFKARAKDSTLPFVFTVLFGIFHETRWISRAHMVYELAGAPSRPDCGLCGLLLCFYV